MRLESTGREATIEDLYREPGKAELVNGRIVRMPSASGLHGYAGLQIAASLTAYARRMGVGHALGDNVGFIVNLPHRKSFCPDAAYHLGPLTMEFVEGAPVFAVEVRSERGRARASPRAHDVDREERGLAGARDHLEAARDVQARGGGGLEDPAELGRGGAGDEATAGREPASGGQAVGLDAAAELQVGGAALHARGRRRGPGPQV